MLPTDGESPDAFEIPEPAKPVTLRLRIDIKDDLAIDNEASLVISPRRLVKALLVTDENPYLQTAIASDPNIDLSIAKPGSPGSEFNSGRYDAIIFDVSAPAKLPEGNYLFVNCS